MVILAIVLLVLGIIFLKGGEDTAKIGVVLLIGALLAALKVDYSFFVWFGSCIIPFFEECLRFICIIVVMIFLGPIMLIFGKKGK